MEETAVGIIRQLVTEGQLRNYVDDDGRVMLEKLQELPPEDFNRIAEQLNLLMDDNTIITEDDQFYFSSDAMDCLLAAQEENDEEREVNTVDLSEFAVPEAAAAPVAAAAPEETDPLKLMIYQTFVSLRMLQINSFSICILPEEFHLKHDPELTEIDRCLAAMVAEGSLEKIQMESGTMIDSGSDGEYRLKDWSRMPAALREKYLRLEKVLAPCEKLSNALPLELRRSYDKKVTIVNSPSLKGEMNDEIAGKLLAISRIYKEAFDLHRELPKELAGTFAARLEEQVENDIDFERILKNFYELKHQYHNAAVERRQQLEAEKQQQTATEKTSLTRKLTGLFGTKS